MAAIQSEQVQEEKAKNSNLNIVASFASSIACSSSTTTTSSSSSAPDVLCSSTASVTTTVATVTTVVSFSSSTSSPPPSTPPSSSSSSFSCAPNSSSSSIQNIYDTRNISTTATTTATAATVGITNRCYQRVADRVQQWNRAIPEAGYITLGTIRYGVRLSTGSQGFRTTGTPTSGSTKVPSETSSNRSSGVANFSSEANSAALPSIPIVSTTSTAAISSTLTRKENSLKETPISGTRSTESTNRNVVVGTGKLNTSCCCSGVILPWNNNNNYVRTKLPKSTTIVKNRTPPIPTSNTLSSSLGVMSAPFQSSSTSSSSQLPQSFSQEISLNSASGDTYSDLKRQENSKDLQQTKITRPSIIDNSSENKYLENSNTSAAARSKVSEINSILKSENENVEGNIKICTSKIPLSSPSSPKTPILTRTPTNTIENKTTISISPIRGNLSSTSISSPISSTSSPPSTVRFPSLIQTSSKSCSKIPTTMMSSTTTKGGRNPIKNSDSTTNVRSSSTTVSPTNSSELCQSYHGICCNKEICSCCKLNSSSSSFSSVSLEQCREQSVSPTLKSPSICCYTIVGNNRKEGLSVKSDEIQLKDFSQCAVLSANNNNNNNNNNSSEVTNCTVVATSALTSPLGYQSSHRKSSDKNGGGGKISTIPPPVPPKPNSTFSDENESVNPINFRRKIQKFEQQNAIEIEKSTRFELFGCFSSSLSTSSSSSSLALSAGNTSNKYNENKLKSGDTHFPILNRDDESDLNKFNDSISSKFLLKSKSNSFISDTKRKHTNGNNNNNISYKIEKCPSTSSANLSGCSSTHLRYNNIGKPVPVAKTGEINERFKVNVSSFGDIAAATVIIKRLTPKLSKKSIPFIDQHRNRGDSEDRLISNDCKTNNSAGDNSDDERRPKGLSNGNNGNCNNVKDDDNYTNRRNYKNRIRLTSSQTTSSPTISVNTTTTSVESALNHSEDNNSGGDILIHSLNYDSNDIGFIDSTYDSTGPHYFVSSSLSDVDVHHFLLRHGKSESEVQEVVNSFRTNNSGDQCRLSKESQNKNFNLSLDSVPKNVLNNNDVSTNNNSSESTSNNSNNSTSLINNNNSDATNNNNDNTNYSINKSCNESSSNNNYYTASRSLSSKDIYESLSDIDSCTTISCLSEDSVFYCICGNSNSNSNINNHSNNIVSNSNGSSSDNQNISHNIINKCDQQLNLNCSSKSEYFSSSSSTSSTSSSISSSSSCGLPSLSSSSPLLLNNSKSSNKNNNNYNESHQNQNDKNSKVNGSSVRYCEKCQKRYLNSPSPPPQKRLLYHPHNSHHQQQKKLFFITGNLSSSLPASSNGLAEIKQEISQQQPNNEPQHLIFGSVKGPILKRVPAIESFNNKNHLIVRSASEKGLLMEKRRNTLDRLQRLGFGRKSSPSPTPSSDGKSSSSGRKSSDKSERLKELTELLKGHRSSSTPPPSSASTPPPPPPPPPPMPPTLLLPPPPIPPPRRLRHTNSIEKPPDNEPPFGPLLTSTNSDDIIPMDEEEEHIPETIVHKKRIEGISDHKRNDGSVTASIGNSSQNPLYQFFNSNTNTTNLENLLTSGRGCQQQHQEENTIELSKSPPKVTPKLDDDLFNTTQLPRAESRTIVGSYTQKTIPFRSVSFSQIDYSSGKYIKSALGAIRDKLRRDKDTSPVGENTSSTLPRKKDSQLSKVGFLKRSNSIEKDTHICPVSANNTSEFNTNSRNEVFENERLSLEEIVNPPDVIFEEDGLALENESKMLEMPEIDSMDVPNAEVPTVLEEKIEEENNLNKLNTMDSEKYEKILERGHETNLATLTEEEIPLESPPENFLQTATTCMIPVPVYECVVGRQWKVDNNTQDKWVDVVQNEVGLISEVNVDEAEEQGLVEPSKVKSSEEVTRIEGAKLQTPSIDILDHQHLPIISVSEDNLPTPETPPLESDMDGISLNSSIHLNGTRGALSSEPSFEDKSTDDRSIDERPPIEYPEVRKRHNSTEDFKMGNGRSQSADSALIRSNEERRKIDKSRRRKGMYIQWPTIDKQGEIDPSEWNNENSNLKELGVKIATPIDLMKVDFSNLKTPSDHYDDPNTPALYFCCKTPDDMKTPSSICSYDPSTPDSEYNRPNWPTLAQRRTSLTLQSSEEKDESLGTSPSQRIHPQRVPFYLRSDSTSDNESDRTPPSIRDRTSPSPAPGDPGDLKRYSKRPLRGPYGQMLEAEMKKPGKHHFDEILEELREDKNTNTLSIHHRGMPGNLSFDESYLLAYQKNQQQQQQQQQTSQQQPSKTNRGGKKSNGSSTIPLPVHTRAASTPSQMENTSTTTTASMTNSSNLEKGYKSNLDIDSMDQNQVNKSKGKDNFKKFSLDSRDKSPKRALSEVNTQNIPEASINNNNNKHSTKRSSSTVSEKQQKRSLDEMRLSQASRTPSDRSMVSSEPGMNNKGSIVPTPELLAELLKGSSERLISEQRQQMMLDTRTHVVQEIFRNEQSYVESLQTVIVKYLNVLKTPEYAGMIDSKTVDEIFYMVPEILSIHEKFLSELRSRLDSWDAQQKVGDAFLETFSKPEVLETYTAFVNNCNRAKDAIRMTCQSRPSFARFLEATAREHKGKLPLDNLLIKPVQKFPNYEMLFTRLIKHTDNDHPDQNPLQEVLKLVHDILVHINCKEKEVLENGQREATLRELEGVIEGISDLVAPERQFLIFDLVSMPSGQGARKDRGFFLFSDLLVITSIKRRSGTIRKPNSITCPGSVASTLDTNKYKFLTKVSLENLEIVKTKDENLRRIMKEIEHLADDFNKLQKITEITATIRYPHQNLEEAIRDLHREVQRQLSERQTNDPQLNLLELTVNSNNGNQKLSVVFSKAEKRSQWEEIFNKAKQKLAASLERHPIPEFLMSIPIRKTRAGLQFTCAAPTLSSQKDVWVCNSDGYVGQVCVLSLVPDPTVTSCNGVCNARILCITSVPAYSETKKRNLNEETPRHSKISNNSNSVNSGNNSNNYSNSHCHQQQQHQQQQQQQNATSATQQNSVSDKSNKKTTAGGDIQLDSNSSSEDSDPEGRTLQSRLSSPGPTIVSGDNVDSTTGSGITHHRHQDSNSDETENQQSTMWLGTEDGCIHVYNCTDNIRIKKNKIKIQHVSAVYSILYLDNRVFVALANGDICVYLRDSSGWNTTSPLCISIGTVSSPVNKLLNVHGKLWCSIQGIIKVLDTKTLQVESQIQISSDSKPITNMAVSSNNVWISIQNSAHIKCFHSNSHELLLEVNLAPSVNKMLSTCDDIIRQHKAACLRVTSLLACRDLIWIGTSAGVLLTIPAQGYTKPGHSSSTNITPVVTGIPHGHTGHVRFLTYVDTFRKSESSGFDDKGNDSKSNNHSSRKNKTKSNDTSGNNGNILIISGGDGYEDFRNSGIPTISEVAGREDSTNHLLLWQM